VNDRQYPADYFLLETRREQYGFNDQILTF